MPDKIKDAVNVIRRHMQENDMDEAAIASMMHPDLDAGDVRRFLNGDPPEREDERELSITSMMIMCADSLQTRRKKSVRK